jgi:hypothetical protein
MRGYRAAMVMVGLAIAFWGTTPAAAQQVSSFELLQLLVKPGDTIIVTDAAGSNTKGEIESLTPESLRLSANKIVREFSQKDARLIRKWKSDSLANGAGIGFVAGAGLGTALAIICTLYGDCPRYGALVYFGTFAAMGTGIGAGVDALFISRHTLYKSPGTAALSFSF